MPYNRCYKDIRQDILKEVEKMMKEIKLSFLASIIEHTIFSVENKRLSLEELNGLRKEIKNLTEQVIEANFQKFKAEMSINLAPMCQDLRELADFCNILADALEEENKLTGE